MDKWVKRSSVEGGATRLRALYEFFSASPEPESHLYADSFKESLTTLRPAAVDDLSSADGPRRAVLRLTFLGQVQLLEFGPFLVELGVQLLLEPDELGPLLLQSCHSLLEHLFDRKQGQKENRRCC